MSEQSVQENTGKALGVVLGVGFVCALLVSTVAVVLRPVQQANIEAERIAQLELVLEALSGIGQARTLDDLEAQIVELDSGAYDDSIDVATYDAERAAAKPGSSRSIPAERDPAGIKSRENHARIYLVRGAGGDIDLIILPVRGRGYQSTLRAWLVLDGDARTVRALKFYQHAETPGVGARIEEPEWEAQWRDLPAYDDGGVLRIGVRSQGGGYDEFAEHKVDAISGATRTSQGVDGMLRFWLGDLGFGPFLQRIREEQL